MIMGDVMDTLELLAPDGLDYGRLTEEEQEANDLSRLSYTDHERKVLRQSRLLLSPQRFCVSFCRAMTTPLPTSSSILLAHGSHEGLAQPWGQDCSGEEVRRGCGPRCCEEFYQG